MLKRTKNWIIVFLGGRTWDRYTREVARLSDIIERHVDDEEWLLRKIGINDPYKCRKTNCHIDRGEITKRITSTRNRDFYPRSANYHKG